MESLQYQSARDEPTVQPPKRIWLIDHWVEAVARIREQDGKFGRRRSNEPEVQFLFPFMKAA